MKTALLFAGQGAQAVGMGQDLASAFPAARALMDRANAVLGYDLARICFEGPEDELTRTENAQPGIYLISWVALALLKERVPGLSFEATAGLSLGEFTALAAAGVMTFEEGLQVVRARGRFMHEACEQTRGGMAALIGLDEAATREVCEAAGVTLANLNCPGQIVISGELDRVPPRSNTARRAAPAKAIPLTVASAYHSPLMASAQPSSPPPWPAFPSRRRGFPLIADNTAQPHGGPDILACLLAGGPGHPCGPLGGFDRWLLDPGLHPLHRTGARHALTYLRSTSTRTQVPPSRTSQSGGNGGSAEGIVVISRGHWPVVIGPSSRLSSCVKGREFWCGTSH
ncbi:MAG: ACP S-malonyltransferase [Verrucomicrobiae bacterium]|nr:ACP S-malonyltransferase [Verrucomicrobiae bacterium]